MTPTPPPHPPAHLRPPHNTPPHHPSKQLRLPHFTPPHPHTTPSHHSSMAIWMERDIRLGIAGGRGSEVERVTVLLLGRTSHCMIYSVTVPTVLLLGRDHIPRNAMHCNTIRCNTL